MDVLIVTSLEIPHAGGLSTHVQLLLEELRAHGHTVRLIEGKQTSQSKPRKLALLLASGGHRDRYRASAFWDHVKSIQRAVKSELGRRKPDLVHSHDAAASAAIATSAALARIPLVQTVHGPMLYETRSGMGPGWPNYFSVVEQAERTAFAKVARFIAVDSGQARILADDYGVSKERIEVIFNCVNEKVIRSLAAGAPPIEPPRPYFLVPRRLVPKTGVRFAIEAISKLNDSNAHLLIAGDGPQKEELERLASHLGVSQRVWFLGAVERGKLMPLFAAATAVIVPSVPSEGVIEATSLAVTEAMAAGTVPLASAIGGLAELIENEATGLLVPPGDASALAGAMRRLLHKPDVRGRLISAASAKVEQEYSAGAWLRRIEAVYAAVALLPVGGEN
jgi:glycosyltransferase involved in cell wall biosynthesis